ncbi:protein serine threonine phosphatase 2C [Flagelloscypha sp. PMI_526]|nr:protein serine threonine phosphatase 2C [Flagelloscypha sp. PMI_526]
MFPSDGPPYTMLSEPAITEELIRTSSATTVGRTSSVSFQACTNPDDRSQDRHVIHDINVQGGTWKLRAIFDGHGGHEVADFLVQVLAPDIEKRLFSLGPKLSTIPPGEISTLLADAIQAVDDTILRNTLALFPNVEAVGKVTPEDVDRIVNQDPVNLLKMHLCMRGSTVLVALLDPENVNLWVASVGDCQAFVGWKTEAGHYEAKVLSSNHNAADPAEAERIRKEHPEETECIHEDRVIGSIAVTRAIGDFLFKLPRSYTEMVFQHVRPGFRFSRPLAAFLQRNLTPPYLCAKADVQHLKLTPGKEGVLILCSDGLTDAYYSSSMTDARLTELGSKLVQLVENGALGSGGDDDVNLSLVLLRHALGGDNLEKLSRNLTSEAASKWMDDITVVVEKLTEK